MVCTVPNRDLLQLNAEDFTEGIYIRFRTNGSVFNLRGLLAQTKTSENLVLELLFADDCALLTHTDETLQVVVTSFAEAAKAFDLTINLKKTKVLHQKPPHGAYKPLSIDGHPLNTAEQFSYLGSVISNDATVNNNNNDNDTILRYVTLRSHDRCQR